MTQEEIAELLAWSSSLDWRLSVNNERDARVKVRAWSVALRSDMTKEFALDYVAKHYGRSKDTLTPADLNDAWRQHRLAQVHEIEQERRSSGEHVPMPAWVKERWQEIVNERRPHWVE